MNYDYEIQNLKKQLNSLSYSVVQLARNNAPVVDKLDSTSNHVEAITPYAETKTGYLGDTEVVFTGAKEGNLSVFVKDTNGNYPNYTVERTGDIITVHFEPLEYITTITISIQ